MAEAGEEVLYQFQPVTTGTEVGAGATAPYISPDEATPDSNQVGSVTMTDQAFQDQMAGIRSDYSLSLADINARFDLLASQITEAQAGIMSQLATNEAMNTAAYENLISDFREQVTNIRNVQQLQVQSAASQLDAMMASGQFGGNVYRSQQVYSSNMANIINQSMGLVAEITLSYRQAAETQRLNFSHQQLSAYISGVSAILSANTDLAKSYALVRSDMTANKNSQLNAIFSLKVQYDIAAQDRASTERIAQQQVEATKLMTQWKIDADLQIATMNVEIENRKIDAQLEIAERNNQISLAIETMRIDSAEKMASWENDLALKLQSNQITSTQYVQSMNAAAQYEMGLMEYEQQMSQYQAQIAQEQQWFDQGLDMIEQNANADYAKTMASYDAEGYAESLQTQQYVGGTASEVESTTGASNEIDWGSYGLPSAGEIQYSF